MVDLTRRNFLRAKKVSTPPAVRLPWTADETLFTRGCTQCGKCLIACEENIIVKGDGGFPEISFDIGECTFCQQCVIACDEPLFNTFDSKPWQLHIEISSDCLATKQVHCQICQDSCEPEAIVFKYLQGSVPQPNIVLSDCSSCGACVSVCPESAIKLSTSLLGAEHE